MGGGGRVKGGGRSRGLENLFENEVLVRCRDRVELLASMHLRGLASSG